MARRCYILDLKDNPQTIAEYDRFHQPGNVWPEIIADIKAQGYREMEIWRSGTRLVMIADVADDFPTGDRAPEVDAIVARWETLMSTLQQQVPGTPAGEKWVKTSRIFSLDQHGGAA